MERLLPTHYFHMVITLPHELVSLTLQHKETVYDLFFQAASQALRDLAFGYPRLQAQISFTAVLHTWNQNLQFHPHLHLGVTGGGLAPSANRWVPSKNNFLVPVKALSMIVRGKFWNALQKAFQESQLLFPRDMESLKDKTAFARFLKKLKRLKWVVYSQEPFGGPEQVYRYVSRYPHRGAISNHRLLRSQDGQVTLRARDHHNPERPRQVTLPVQEFIHRFLLHGLPPGFVTIRPYGLLAPWNAKTKLEKARPLILQMESITRNDQKIAQPKQEGFPPLPTWKDLMYHLTHIDLKTCPRCRKGPLVRRPLTLAIEFLISTKAVLLDSS
jgi:hypothetical protein